MRIRATITPQVPSNELGVDVEQRDSLEELDKGCTGHTLLLLRNGSELLEPAAGPVWPPHMAKPQRMHYCSTEIPPALLIVVTAKSPMGCLNKCTF